MCCGCTASKAHSQYSCNQCAPMQHCCVLFAALFCVTFKANVGLPASKNKGNNKMRSETTATTTTRATRTRTATQTTQQKKSKGGGWRVVCDWLKESGKAFTSGVWAWALGSPQCATKQLSKGVSIEKKPNHTLVQQPKQKVRNWPEYLCCFLSE